MASVKPNFRWTAKVTSSVGFCLAGALAGVGLYFGLAFLTATAGPPCGPSAGAPALPDGSVVIGSNVDDFPEDQLIAYIYRDALQGNGVPVNPLVTPSSRTAYYDQVCTGAVTIVPEYNGALLTTSVDPDSTAVTTVGVDDALDQDLPPSLAVLAPAPAQNKDSVTVTQATAARYGLKSITDLRRVAGKLTIGAPVGFDGREQGTAGLKSTYGVTFGRFVALDYSETTATSVTGLLQGVFDAADVFTANPEITADHLVVLADPKGLFRAENVMPLVYKPAVQANPRIATVLNFVSLRLTQFQLLELNAQAAQPGASLVTIAGNWVKANLQA